MHKHSETALDTPEKEGTESSFPIKVHSVVPRKEWSSVKSYGFTDEVVKMGRLIRKMAGFYGRLKGTCSNYPFGAANVMQKPKEKSQTPENQRFAIVCTRSRSPVIVVY